MSEISQDLLDNLMQDCDREANKRYDHGQRKYTPNSYLHIDTLQHAIDEVLDLINYGRFTYIKLRLLQAQLAENPVTSKLADGSIATATGPEMPGKPPVPTGFITALKAASVTCCEAGKVAYPDPCPWHPVQKTDEEHGIWMATQNINNNKGLGLDE